MSYMALYRKWRPRVFEDVVGQEHITQTLKNQIKSDSIAHAYLFCGTRGTGKTSTAKIFARAVNCLHPVDFNPCNTCEICTGIKNETMIDVIEIDAASNNGVDDIRELREKVKYPPAKGKFKVYIIDEVHMLSTGAFNALLKTLEEPPHFVIFILATTEPHKIPATILSRCQRFDFKRVKEKDMVDLLAHICQHTGVQAEESALKMIARNSDGAMRDALSILDQCVSYSAEKINYDDVVNVLGTVTDEFMFELVDHVTSGNSTAAIELLEGLVAAGKDIQQFIKDLIHHYRNLMMTKVAQSLEGIVNLSAENIQRLKEQGTKLETTSMMRAIHILSQIESEAKWSTQPRILLEVGIIKLTQPMWDASIEGLMDRIRVLEKMVQTGVVKVQPSIEEKPAIVTRVEKESVKDQSPKETKPVEKEIKGSPASFEAIQGAWADILKEIKKRKITVHAWLMEGQPAQMDKNTLFVSFKEGFGFHKEAAGNSPNKEFIENVIAEMTGQRLQLKCVMEEELSRLMGTSEEISVDQEEDLDAKKIIELFGADLVEIVDE